MKFLEHFAAISDAIDGQGIWDDTDGLYYDRLLTPGGADIPVKVRSMVGMIPMLAVAVLDQELLDRAVSLGKHFSDFLKRQGLDDPEKLRQLGVLRGDPGQQRLLLSVVDLDRLEKLFARLFDENEFLSPYGLRALSAYHRDHPYTLDIEGAGATIDYEPAESTTPMFGGNSNWRGPLWFPLNYLVVSSLERYHRFFGDEFTLEYPAGSGRRLPLDAIAADLQDRLISIFLVGPDGRRPCFGWVERLQHGPGVEGQPRLQRVLPRRQRGRPRRLPPDRLDGRGRRHDPPPSRGGPGRRRRAQDAFQAGPVMTAVQEAATPLVLPGSQFPLGATPGDGGTNFAVASSVADAMTLCLFDGDGRETQVPLQDYDAGVWHGFVPGVGPGQAYGYRAERPLRSGAGPALQPGEAAARPLRPGDQRRGHVRAGGAGLRGGQPGRAERARLRRAYAAQPGRGRRVRLDRRQPAPAPLLRHDHLRGARQGLHHAPPRTCRPSCAAPTPGSGTRPPSAT